MPYTTNPRMPKLRAKAVNMVRSGQSVSEVARVARYFGYTKGAVSKWCQKVPAGGAYEIPTLSSRPRHHPKELPAEIVNAIIACKKKYRRCSDVIHRHLLNDGIKICLNSVKRKLDEAGLIKKRSVWKRLHLSVERPLALKPGDLIIVDTIHLMMSDKRRIYVYTLIELSIKFLSKAQMLAPFKFGCVQSDWGSEFSQHFSERIKALHRHSRVRKPNDNSYLERFNRTLQEECLRNLPLDVKIFNRALPAYLAYYNQERLHMGINFQTPNQLLKCFQAIG